MKKVLFLLAVVLMSGATDSNAQGFLKKLKQKAQTAVSSIKGTDNVENKDQQDADSDEAVNPSNIVVAQGDDIVPKRKTSTITWDGIITPSTASTAAALMKELPALPSAEKMARCSMEERGAYTQKIAAVVARAEQLQKSTNGCSDAEMEALRQKWENKIQDMFGLTKEEFAILSDENASEAKKEPIRQKMLTKIMGNDGADMAEMQRFEKKSEKEQEAYIKAHPEFMQKMMKMGQNAGSFAKKANLMNAALNGYTAKLGKLAMDYSKTIEREENHSYEGIARKYNTKLQKLYAQICDIDDASQIDKLYAEADELLYEYRLEAAKEYRESLQRQIVEVKKFASEYARLSQEVIDSGDLPECAVGRMDLNAVIMVGNLLDEAYKELPELEAQPVCMETIYSLPQDWSFGLWECRGFIGAVDGFKAGANWPLLAEKALGDEREYGVVENGKFRKISEDELKSINKQADLRQKNTDKTRQKPPYGTYKSRSGQRMVEYSKTGELIVNGMTSFAPIAFTAKSNLLEWIILSDRNIVKCTYKL